MIATVLMLGFAVTAAITDAFRHKIYNWTTYTGIVTAVVTAALATLLSGWDRSAAVIGSLPLGQSLLGLLACGAIMLVCYVFFRIGGGDVKLLAMLGAFMGPENGILVLLWTFVLGGAVGLITLIWKIGAVRLLNTIGRYAAAALTLKGFSHLRGSLGSELATSLFLAPSALVAVILVRFDLLQQFAPF
jgi:prepilin peptidase CpaA